MIKSKTQNKTFGSFLEEYVCYIAYIDKIPSDVAELLSEAEASNYRLREILILYLLVTHGSTFVETLLKEYPELNKIYIDNRDSLLINAYRFDEDCPFHKIYRSYMARISRV